jgi:hypothetical protein
MVSAHKICISSRGDHIFSCPYNVESAKKLLLLSKLSEYKGDAILKAITDNEGVLKNIQNYIVHYFSVYMAYPKPW